MPGAGTIDLRAGGPGGEQGRRSRFVVVLLPHGPARRSDHRAEEPGRAGQGAYFGTVRMLAESTAAARGDLDAAIESYSLYTESEASGVDTLRHLANLYEQKASKGNDNGSVLNALRMTEQGLMYNSSDKDLLEKKDRYYNDLEPATVTPKLESVRKWFDMSYCLRKSRTILDGKNADLDMIEWGGSCWRSWQLKAVQRRRALPPWSARRAPGCEKASAMRP